MSKVFTEEKRVITEADIKRWEEINQEVLDEADYLINYDEIFGKKVRDFYREMYKGKDKEFFRQFFQNRIFARINISKDRKLEESLRFLTYQNGSFKSLDEYINKPDTTHLTKKFMFLQSKIDADKLKYKFLLRYFDDKIATNQYEEYVPYIPGIIEMYPRVTPDYLMEETGNFAIDFKMYLDKYALTDKTMDYLLKYHKGEEDLEKIIGLSWQGKQIPPPFEVAYKLFGGVGSENASIELLQAIETFYTSYSLAIEAKLVTKDKKKEMIHTSNVSIIMDFMNIHAKILQSKTRLGYRMKDYAVLTLENELKAIIDDTHMNNAKKTKDGKIKLSVVYERFKEFLKDRSSFINKNYSRFKTILAYKDIEYNPDEFKDDREFRPSIYMFSANRSINSPDGVYTTLGTLTYSAKGIPDSVYEFSHIKKPSVFYSRTEIASNVDYATTTFEHKDGTFATAKDQFRGIPKFGEFLYVKLAPEQQVYKKFLTFIRMATQDRQRINAYPFFFTDKYGHRATRLPDMAMYLMDLSMNIRMYEFNNEHSLFNYAERVMAGLVDFHLKIKLQLGDIVKELAKNPEQRIDLLGHERFKKDIEYRNKILKNNKVYVQFREEKVAEYRKKMEQQKREQGQGQNVGEKVVGGKEVG